MYDSRTVEGNRRRRLYRCSGCSNRFSTIEEIVVINNPRGAPPVQDLHDVQRLTRLKNVLRTALLKAIEDA